MWAARLERFANWTRCHWQFDLIVKFQFIAKYSDIGGSLDPNSHLVPADADHGGHADRRDRGHGVDDQL